MQEVPPRATRKKRDEESYCLGLYLLALDTASIARYPIRVLEAESPDFLVTTAFGEKTGLEVTKATSTSVQSWMSAAEREFERRKREAARTGSTARPVARSWSQRGWLEGEAEIEWRSFFCEAVSRKLPRLSSFAKASRHDLLIYDDTPFPSIDRNSALAALIPWLQEQRERYPLLGRVSVIASLDVILDLGGRFQTVPFIDWSSPDEYPDFGERAEFAAKRAGREVLEQHRRARNPIYSEDERGRLVKEHSNGRRYEITVSDAGEERIVSEIED